MSKCEVTGWSPEQEVKFREEVDIYILCLLLQFCVGHWKPLACQWKSLQDSCWNVKTWKICKSQLPLIHLSSQPIMIQCNLSNSTQVMEEGIVHKNLLSSAPSPCWQHGAAQQLPTTPFQGTFWEHLPWTIQGKEHQFFWWCYVLWIHAFLTTAQS